MKRERQWDMFDVATGACELDDYLAQRYSENDLQSKFWVEPGDEVDELQRPKGSKEQTVIPVQRPRSENAQAPSPPPRDSLPQRPPWEAPTQANPLPSRPPWEEPTRPQPAPPAAVSSSPPPAQTPSSEPPIRDLEASPAPMADRPDLPVTPAPPSMEELLARFHQAAKAYEQRAGAEQQGDKEELTPEG